MKELLQSLKCLLGFHRVAMRRQISNRPGEGRVQFVCIHCGKEI